MAIEKTNHIDQMALPYSSTDPELAAVDRSVRWPVIFAFLSSVHWMVTGTFLLVYGSSLTHPHDSIPVLGLLIDLSNNFSFFTYGRVWPAAVDALVYGWASTAGLGLVIWILARLGRRPVKSPAALMTAIVFWDLGVAVGLTGIFLGNSSGFELLEFPYYASWLLWIAYALFAVWTVVHFFGRRVETAHPAQAWLLVAIFSFPWLYGAGSILLGHGVPQGSNVVQAMINAWYVHGIFTLWIAPLGLGTLFYLVPKVSGLGLRHASKISLAFWLWLLLAPWTAVHDMVGGPFPAGVVTLGLIMSGLIFVPVALIGISLLSTSTAGEEKHHDSIVLPFLTLACAAFVAVGALEEILSFRGANTVLRFTLFRECNLLFWVYGFFSLVVFGAMYYIVPRLLDFGWRSSVLLKAHYYAAVYGVLLLIALLGFGGVMQGFALENTLPQVTIASAVGVTLSFSIAATACIALVAIGNGIFAFHLGWLFLDWWGRGPRVIGQGTEVVERHYDAAIGVDPAIHEESHL